MDVTIQALLRTLMRRQAYEIERQLPSSPTTKTTGEQVFAFLVT